MSGIFRRSPETDRREGGFGVEILKKKAISIRYTVRKTESRGARNVRADGSLLSRIPRSGTSSEMKEKKWN